jgi:hypothetical protein
VLGNNRGNNRDGKLKLTIKDDTRSRVIYISGRISNNTIMSEGKDTRFVKTNMSRVEKELRDFLK